MRRRRHIALASFALAACALVVACATSDDSVTGGKGGSDAGGAAGGSSGGSDSGGTGGTQTGGSGGTAGTPDGGGAAGSDGGGLGGAAGSDGSAGDGGCSAPSDCPSTTNECVLATCNGGVCGTANAPAGTVTVTQTVGDCRKTLCDGLGGTVSSNDDSDVPDDQNPCTVDGCASGTPTHNKVAAGTSCGTGLVCDSAGNCSGCSVGADCPGQDTECSTRTCSSGVCGVSFTAAGTKTSAQTAGDCKSQQCDGAGNVTTVIDNSDVPVDGKQCTSDVCSAGTPSNPPSPSGTACSENGGNVCNGSGTCVGCIVATNCPGSDTDCIKRTCIGNACGVSYTASGTATTSQITGDCKTNVCDGAGGVTTSVNNGDVPVDGNQCTSDVCTAGTPSNPPLAAETACSQNGGKVCNGSGSCVQCVSNADCSSGLCQSNTCSGPVCSSGTIDCDGLSSNGCECSGTLCCGTACLPTHHNGLGQTYDDCAPLGVPGNAATYSVTMAGEARAAWPFAGTDGLGSCKGPSSGNVVYRQTATSCAVWAYTNTLAGRVMLNTASNTCQCPSPTGTTWD